MPRKKDRKPGDDVPVQFYVEPALKERAEACAKAEPEKLTLSQWLRRVMRQAVEQSERQRERKGK